MSATNLPEKNLEWHLFGAGLESLGEADGPSSVPVPEIKPNELLVKVDACGLCFSDTKVVALGENHPRLTGRNLKIDPVVLGHEVACTVVKVGAELEGRYQVGQRFIVQADVFYKGESMAFGYVFKGGLAQYQVIPHEMLSGDDGSYLLPIQEKTGVVEAALVEPWACVVSAYALDYRRQIKDGGRMLIIQASGEQRVETLFENATPALIVTFGLSERVEDQLPDTEITEHEGAVDWPAIREQYTQGEGFDDILLLGDVPVDVVEGAIDLLARYGVCNIVRTSLLERAVSLDVGRVHYDYWLIVGAHSDNAAQGYVSGRTADLVKGGRSWFIGAGGPMGQMHVQRAVQHPNPPSLVVATDVDDVRLEEARGRYEEIAASRGIKYISINPTKMSPAEFDAELLKLAPEGFDDVVCMVPIAAVIEHGAKWVGPNGIMNIFAGAARGTRTSVDLNPVVNSNVAYYGSSGSSLADIQNALDQMESGALQTRASLAAIGGLNAAKEGIAAVKEGKYPGKIVILPHFPDLPLMTLAELKEKYPTVGEKLERGKFWTTEAEQEFLRALEAERA